MAGIAPSMATGLVLSALTVRIAYLKAKEWRESRKVDR
jgi:hypothetical protein